ncbi:MetQ/NlpA family ABC transporter substrate-binding protein [Pediococcus pentosaceus]|uniref:Lipoprotein n=1 Tax=Pediococcus pentosaceus TaxID=1255 RepID=A0AB73HE09_PEDPE|nr:MetQ/NlpA family ABC transporter substrate-binding protein [Pediococcus pentosaceus]MBF7114708.1 methionine ABC transporter substrate-binding protein [Pediococcus pentosaceus]MCM6792621.1 MetQ/NlpA family ABC transporter substrate-binding protein [Pediococcus pentosaceus]MDN3206464.1 MetQ/NlpA family ABC transporter substrate-binding protein [Pediococcus pentosaceus]
MKKSRVLTALTIAATAVVLAACGSTAKKTTTVTIGASPTPHAEILKHIQPELKKEGVNLKIKQFQDYVLPNKALASKDIDANYFQHTPFLKEWNAKNKGNLISAGSIHLEPIAVYSKKYKSLKDLPKNATVLVSNNVADYGRVLEIFKDDGLITLKKGTDSMNANFKDIATNKKNIKFKTGYEPKLMPQLYNNKQGDAEVINSNYAVQAKLSPAKDAIAVEKSSSPYSNIVAIRPDEKNNKALKKVIKALKSKSTQSWIKKHFKGSVEPVE